MYKEPRIPSGVTGGSLETELLGKMDERSYLQEAKSYLERKHHLSKPVLNEYEMMAEFQNMKYNFSQLLKDMVMSRDNIDYIDYDHSRQLVEVCQRDGSQPDRPQAFFARSLYNKLKAELDKIGNYQLEYYTAVSSHLDVKHGVDAYFKVLSSGQEVAQTTLDVTSNPNKSDGYKADYVSVFPHDGLDPRDDREEYAAKVDETAQALWDKLEPRLVK